MPTGSDDKFEWAKLPFLFWFPGDGRSDLTSTVTTQIHVRYPGQEHFLYETVPEPSFSRGKLEGSRGLRKRSEGVVRSFSTENYTELGATGILALLDN